MVELQPVDAVEVTLVAEHGFPALVTVESGLANNLEVMGVDPAGLRF
jgi:hypothetical protein